MSPIANKILHYKDSGKLIKKENHILMSFDLYYLFPLRIIKVSSELAEKQHVKYLIIYPGYQKYTHFPFGKIIISFEVSCKKTSWVLVDNIEYFNLKSYLIGILADIDAILSNRRG